MTETKPPYINKPLLLLALTHVITDLSQGALPILLPLFKSAFDLSYAQVGMIVLAQNLTSSVIQPVFGYLTDRFFLPWLLPVGVLLSGLALAAAGLVNSYYLLLGVIIIGGLGIAAFHPQASKGAHLVSAECHKGRGMAVFALGGNIGQACGSIFIVSLLTLPGQLSNIVYFCLPSIFAAGLLWLNLSQVAPVRPAKATGWGKGAARIPIPYVLLVILLLFIFVRSSILAGLTTYIPLYYSDYLGGSPLYSSYLVSVLLFAGAAGTFVGGALGDKFGRKAVIMASMLACLPLINLLPYTSGLGTFILMGFTGLSLISSFATTTVLAQEMLPGYEAMAASLTIGFSIGLGGIGATLLGYIADHFGIPSIFTVLGVLPLAAVALVSRLPKNPRLQSTAAQG